MNEPLILASGSPRRRDFLAGLGLVFEIIPSRTDEMLDADKPIEEAIAELALRKAREVAGRVGGRRWVLAADTVVVVDGEGLGKPQDAGDAKEMLAKLSGRSHEVCTGVALEGPGFTRTLAVSTVVRFKELTESEIAWYISTGDPFDKAGAYGIQSAGSFLVESIVGSYTNVVGLPMAETVDLLESAEIIAWRNQNGTGMER